MSISHDDIAAGLVVRLDTAVLRARGGALTNAVLGPDGDRAISGESDFLILSVDAKSGMCTAVPLFPKSAVGNQPLEADKKTGPRTWKEETTYFSRWQHWRVPSASIVAASSVDDSAWDTRRYYSQTDRSPLDDVKNWEGRNRAAYRAA